MKEIIFRTEDDDFIVAKFELNVEGVHVYAHHLLYHNLTDALDSIRPPLSRPTHIGEEVVLPKLVKDEKDAKD